MAFESLSERLQSTLKKVSGQGQLTESNMQEMLTEIRLALLEADVNYDVVKEFIASTKEKAKNRTFLSAVILLFSCLTEPLHRFLGFLYFASISGIASLIFSKSE